MNTECIGLDGYNPLKNKAIAVAPEMVSGAPEKVKNKDKTDRYTGRSNVPDDAESAMVGARANALPDLRDERLAAVADRIKNGYYSTRAFEDDLSGLLASAV